jgi:hypothetical protein
MKVDLADPKVFARLDRLYSIAQSFRAATWLFVGNVDTLAHVSVERFTGDVNGTIERAEQYAQATGVIAVFVSDEHGIEPLCIFTNHREPACDLFRAESGVDKHARVTGNDQNRVTS